ncbi:MAG: hydrogenase maturation protease [Desulfobacteraceae bacterium]|nr:hydrogenase maturation protease [Desulfobacteraceae bacterium]
MSCSSTHRAEDTRKIMVIGIGCPLYCDQGFGVAVVQALQKQYIFPENVQLVDGGLVGIGLTGLIGQSDYIIAVDIITGNGKPGDLYRLEGTGIFQRFKVKNHIQQVEFLEAVAHCRALDDPAHVVLLGIEPNDTKTVTCELSPALQKRQIRVINMVLDEMEKLGVTYQKR